MGTLVPGGALDHRTVFRTVADHGKGPPLDMSLRETQWLTYDLLGVQKEIVCYRSKTQNLGAGLRRRVGSYKRMQSMISSNYAWCQAGTGVTGHHSVKCTNVSPLSYTPDTNIK